MCRSALLVGACVIEQIGRYVPWWRSRELGMMLAGPKLATRAVAMAAAFLAACGTGGPAEPVDITPGSTIGSPFAPPDTGSTTRPGPTPTTSLVPSSTDLPSVTVLPPTASDHRLPALAATSGWLLEPGDVVVSSGDGVQVFRNGAVVATPVTTPTEIAISDGRGGLVVLPPEEERWPNFWPDLFGGGGRRLWHVTPDGVAEPVYEGSGEVKLFDVAVVEPVSDDIAVQFTEYRDIFGDGSSDSFQDSVMLLPLDGTGPVHVTDPVGSFEGGVLGVTWHNDRFIVSMGAEGFNWMSAHDVQGEPVPWPANPAPFDENEELGVWSMTGIPGTDLIAYIETSDHPSLAPSVLVIYDTVTGDGQTRVEVAEADVWVKLLHATEDKVAVTRVTTRNVDGRFRHVYLPVLVYDLEDGTIEQLDTAGMATFVRR